jgi:hypothetical protein
MNAAACVDETGYDCSDERAFVDETGYLKTDNVWYTAANALDALQRVTVLGFPDAICPVGGKLTVEGPNQTEPIEVDIKPDGAFHFDTQAEAGDKLQFRYDLPDVDTLSDSLTLDDSLNEVVAPMGGGTSSGSDPPLLSSPNAEGQVAIDFSALSAGAPPFIAFNDTQKEGAVVSESGESVSLDASIGDSICIFSTDSMSGARSSAFCSEVM